MDSDRGNYDAGEASHRALKGIQRELERHPTISSVNGFPDGEYTQVVAEVATERHDLGTTAATLTVRWFAGEQPSDPAQFSFHYSDDAGDFGWHHEPNPHVDGWGHFQERPEPGSEYTYEPYSFSSTNPTRVVWEVMSRLSARVEDR